MEQPKSSSRPLCLGGSTKSLRNLNKELHKNFHLITLDVADCFAQLINKGGKE
jgi:hypothetical protein